MRYAVTKNGVSRSFPDGDAFLQGAVAADHADVMIYCGAPYRPSQHAAVLVELHDECLAVHTGEHDVGANVLGFARYRNGNDAPSKLIELVRGPNLAQLVEEQGALPIPRVLRLLREALSALSQAHAQNLVHRDIKPENMLLAPGGNLKITDFGLALALRGQGRFSGATSQSGTPQFASPEQLLGERVDQRSDLYSLAAVAYFALLGYPPFTGATPEQILARQATDQIPDLREERPELNPRVVRVLERAIQAGPDRRFASAAEFQQALREASRRTFLERAVDMVRRVANPPNRGSS